MYCYNWHMDRQRFEQRYPFALDPYQVEAIDHLSKGLSVLVAAPTGSGKTIVAEYALEMARSAGKRFFYTTPLKALSNQKFRDLSRAGAPGEVGLLTGDNSINGEAPLVVMTTEVLRNMLYERSPLLDDLGAVVLDEVHYMHDPFRGAVWEEIVILLPSAVKLVGLSATISNASELGEWMDSLRGDVRVVVSTERPVKLKNLYFVWRSLVPLFAKNLMRVIGEQMDIAKKSQAARDTGRRRRGASELTPRREEVIKELERREMLPAIYFLFSRAGCADSVSRWLEKGDRLNPPEAAREVEAYLDERVATLEKADLECLDYARFRRALANWVAAHHAWELPLFKEVVEELFARGLVKVVFATETLSLGINMPARTVVIESLSKWTGEKHRPLSPGEYKQLTGRAGRRGIDEVGYSVVLYQKYFSPDQVRSLVTRESSPVVSSFQVTYNMAVNVLATHDLAEAQKLINLSFAQFVADRRVVDLEARLEVLREDLARELEASTCVEGGDAGELRSLQKERDSASRRLATMSRDRKQQETREALNSLQAGDVFIAGAGESRRVVAVVRKPKDRKSEKGVLVVDSGGRYRRMSTGSFDRPPEVIGAVEVSKVTSPTRKVRRTVGAKMETLAREASSEKGGAGRSPDEKALANESAGLKARIDSHPCSRCRHRDRCLEAARRAERIERQITSSGKERDAGYDVVSKRLVDVVSVLNRFGFMLGEKPTPKGETLRRIYNECDLLLVEALYGGLFSTLEPRELAAVAAWAIYESREGDTLRERGTAGPDEYLQGALGEVLVRLDAIEDELKGGEGNAGLDLLGSLDTGFGEAAHMWAGGAELEDMLDRFPGRSVGDMVRKMKQIIDLLRQLEEVSPDPVLQRNLRKAMDDVDRGVVGYSSLESIIEHVSGGA